MKRRPHILARNHATQLPSNCIWFDTETKPQQDDEGRDHHHLWFGYACYQRRISGSSWEPPIWFRFETISEFWDWVETRTRKKTRLYIFSHNGAFDLPVMHAFTELPKRGWKLTGAIADAPPLVLTWKRDGMTIRFVDTLNIWRMSLDAIGESIGIPKLEFPGYEAPQDVWESYGKRDVEVIRKACLSWFDFIRDNDLGGFAVTLASQSFNAYRHRFMPVDIFIDDRDKETGIARSAYFGGRTEAFFIGSKSGTFYYIDINSMYPSVMLEEEYPHKLLGSYLRPSTKEIADWSENYAVIAECTIETDQPCYPAIRDGKLIFPVGRFRCNLPGPEFKLALNHGHIVNTSRIVLYEKAALFSDYIEFMYEHRLKAKRRGDTVNTWLYKIMMNSLYGKFGQRGRQWDIVGEDTPDNIEVWQELDADTGEVRNLRSFGGIIQELKLEDEGRDSFPAIAAYVTSYARLKLWEAIEAAGQRNCFYCDTDSLVVNQTGYNRLKHLIDPDQLGAWALEKTLSHITIHGPKDYIFDDEQKVKGVRKNAEWLSDNQVRQDHFVGLKGLLRMKDLSGPIVYPLEKTLNRIYTKGEVLPSGRVRPLRLSDD